MKLSNVTGVKIDGVCACVPSTVVDNAAFGAELFGDRIEDTLKVTGIRARRACPPDGSVTSMDLCLHAARTLLERHPLTPSEIGGVLFVTQTPDHDMPNNASVAAHRLELPHACAAVDTAFGCSGYVYGLWLAALTANALIAPVLLLAGETQSTCASPHDRATALLFGDAGTATLVVPEGTDTWRFGFLTDGSKKDVLLIPGGRSRQPFDEGSLSYRAWPDGGVRRPIDIYMDGMAVFDFVVRNVPKCLKELMKSSGTTSDDLDFLLLHQANLFMIKQVAKLLGFPPEKMPISLDRYGNSSSATLPVTICSELAETLATRRLEVLAAGFGAGLSVAAAHLPLGPCVCPGVVEYPVP